jgi:signal transduction histidine kinase
MNGTVVAHGQLANLVGKNLLTTKDPRGKQYVQERIELAKAKGSGWHDYTFLNPVSKKWEPKRSYIEKADDLIFGSGTYRMN